MTVAAEVRAPDKAMLGCSVAPFTGPGGLPQPCRFHNNSYANRIGTFSAMVMRFLTAAEPIGLLYFVCEPKQIRTPRCGPRCGQGWRGRGAKRLDETKMCWPTFDTELKIKGSGAEYASRALSRDPILAKRSADMRALLNDDLGGTRRWGPRGGIVSFSIRHQIAPY
jgi:hypothetical protein